MLNKYKPIKRAMRGKRKYTDYSRQGTNYIQRYIPSKNRWTINGSVTFTANYGQLSLGPVLIPHTIDYVYRPYWDGTGSAPGDTRIQRLGSGLGSMLASA